MEINQYDITMDNDVASDILYDVTMSNDISIIGKWSASVSDEDKQGGMQVLELCIERDCLNEWVFGRGKSLIL